MQLNLINLRKYLHQNPELSNQEENTSKYINSVMLQFNPDQILSLGKHSRAFIFDSGKKGPVIAFRAELDALPIEERSQNHHRSQNKGVSHVCGHDGHMSIIVGLAQKLQQKRPKIGKVILVFQSAEETGEGARDLMSNKDFKALNIDYIFGLHNIPSLEMGAIAIRKGSFAAASRGMILKLIGKTSHAAEPERGINPALAIAEITRQLDQLIQTKDVFKSLTILTFIYTKMGKIAFGTSAGRAEMGFTLRAFENDDIELLCNKSAEIIAQIAKENRLEHHISFTEAFPATICEESAFKKIQQAAKNLKYPLINLKEPMRWSEDFGHYHHGIKSGFFGIGSGLNQAQLHNPDFDFPDELIDKGASIFFEILQSFY